MDLSQKISLGAFVIGVVLIFQLISSASTSNALLDATLSDEGEPLVRNLEGTGWIILRKRLTWGEASAYCDLKYFRLAMLPTKALAEELVNKIASISEPYSQEYDRKYMSVEFGMDRRYWIGLTDQVEFDKWYWTHDGSPLKYHFWYPGQPDHQISLPDNTREHCVSLWNPGYHYGNKHSFNDEWCLGENYAICDTKEKAPGHGGVAITNHTTILHPVPHSQG
ncbi:unnamed protein product [Orchesella dallaii]|uniref:C-type lectin domain-containing protein n=1 Tax=Orchesella dallaii TaxID=48710 RepID=A0ABP1PLJ1_9HEXA